MATNTIKPTIIGIKFPFEKGSDGLPATLFDAEAIRSDLLYLLTTRQGERVMLLDFGLDLEKFVFDNTGPLLRAKIYRHIVTAVDRYENRVKITNIIVQENKNLVAITVEYVIFGFEDSVSFDFPKAA